MKILGSLIFCFVALALFLSVAVASRQELPIGLVELYGDISGISTLTIEGEVFSRNGQYGYSFTIAPDRQRTRMHIINNSRAFDALNMRGFYDFNWRWRWSTMHYKYLPIDNAQPIAAYSDSSFFIDHTGGRIPIPEYRIYGEVFEVIPLFLFSYSLYTPTHEHQLFICAGPGAYITSPREEREQHFHQTLWQLVRPVFPMRSSGLQFLDEAHFGDKRLIVPTGLGLFGNTAVYAVYMPENILPTIGCLYSNMIEASVLLPITLERGEDEIIGLLELEESALLVISRYNGYEVTRINPATGRSQTIFVETNATFHRHYLCDNFLILHGFSSNHDDIIAALDLRNNSISIVGVIPIAAFYDGDRHIEVRDIILSNGIVYVAYSTSQNPWNHIDFSTRTFISAFNNSGQLIGHAQVLNGVEDDAFWIWAEPDISQQYQRTLQSLTLRGSY